MKAIIYTIFAVLVAGVIAVAVFLGLRNREASRDLLERRAALRIEKSRIEEYVKDKYQLLPDTLTLKTELDSLERQLQESEDSLKVIFGNRMALSRTPVLFFDELKEIANWRVYPFQIVLHGKQAAIDDYLANLNKNFPYLKFESFQGQLLGKDGEIRLVVKGTVSFPGQ